MLMRSMSGLVALGVVVGTLGSSGGRIQSGRRIESLCESDVAQVMAL